MFNRQVFFKAVYGLQGLIIDKRGDTCNISLSKQFHAEDLASSTTGDVQRMSFNLWYAPKQNLIFKGVNLGLNNFTFFQNFQTPGKIPKKYFELFRPRANFDGKQKVDLQNFVPGDTLMGLLRAHPR